MREVIIKKASSSLMAFMGLLILFIFIASMRHPEKKKQYTYLALGDSYTIGEKVQKGENFPYQTVSMLRSQGLDFRSPRIVAKTGWTTDELQSAIKSSRLKSHYDFVTLLIGVNNQYRGRDVASFNTEFEQLLQRSIKLAQGKTDNVLVLSIPDWGVTPFARGRDQKQIEKEIDEFNAAVQLISDKYKVKMIDITPGTRKALNDGSLLTEDSLHPSGKEYRKWAEQVAAHFSKRI